MRTVAITQYGGPEALAFVEMPDPSTDPGRVLIRTTAGGLNPVDALQRNGFVKALAPYSFPCVAGNELSGIVEAVGAGVTDFAPGDAVIVRTGNDQLGAFAELVACDSALVAKAPTSIPLADAAGLPLAGLTAQQALGPDHLDIQPDDRLLITGAAGGVGLLAIQLAKLKGAHATVTASSEGEPLVRSAGADDVINYRERKIAEAGRTFTKVFDLVGGDSISELFTVVEQGGKVVTISGAPTPGSLQETARGWRKAIATLVEHLGSRKLRGMAKQAGVSYEFFLMHPDGKGLATLVELIDDGKLKLVIDSRFPVADFADAYARLESRRAKGKVILEF